MFLEPQCWLLSNPLLILRSETVDSQIYKFKSALSKDGYLIDTPGIDESNRTRTDIEIMQQIHNELDNLKLYDKTLMGIIFLYDISQPRAYGTVLNVYLLKVSVYGVDADSSRPWTQPLI